MASASDYLMMAAIDLGTTFSGYACSFVNEKEKIMMNKNWSHAAGFESYKTPTSVLTDGEGNFLHFGYEAEEHFAENQEKADLEADDGLVENQLYRQFKMVLHQKEKLTMDTVGWSTTWHVAQAIDLFTHALRFLKDHLLNALAKQLSPPPTASVIRWVITVPAIWNEEAKQFMREAAYRSGCITSKDSKQLIIALEPEAASFFCRTQNLVHFDENEHVTFPSGTQYLVLDCGGGTNDMVVHEVIVDFQVKELFAVSGGSHGATRVDAEYLQLLKEILGEEFVQSFASKYPVVWFSFISKFERAKKVTNVEKKSKVKIEVPYNFEKAFAETYPEESLEKHLKGMQSKGINFRNGFLEFSYELVQSLFDETVQNIVEGVKKVIRHPKIKNLKYIIMVGGFSECLFLQKAIKDEFSSNDCTVVIPNEAQLAIIKGAVLYGYYHDQVISRIARKTYGYASSPPFDPSIHDESHKFTDPDGVVRCRNVFVPLVVQDEEIATGTRKEQFFNIPYNKMVCSLSFYSLPREPKTPTQYIDDPNMERLGQISTVIPEHPSIYKRGAFVTFIFGSTEIVVEVRASSASRIYRTILHFLSDDKLEYDEDEMTAL